ncbi:hypothetical protein BC829DRAFT_405207 [Chytridium lagenaria]|nr:hypothetical protein BC829DRAFT_405207 [Chytridium lagenaria]
MFILSTRPAITSSLKLAFTRGNAYLNKVILMGHMGKDPEFFAFPSKVEDGQNVKGTWTFPLATTRSYKKGEDWVKDTQWHNIKVYSTATSSLFSTGRLGKGALVTVDGRLEYNRDEANKRTFTNIVAEDIRINRWPQPQQDESAAITHNNAPQQ